MEITGRLTANGEVKNVRNGKKVTAFTIAINRTYKQGGERKTITKYVDCSYWVNTGVAEYLKKGALVQLSGDIDVNAWIDKEGNAKGRLTFHTEKIQILAFSGNREGEQTGPKDPKSGNADSKKSTANGAPEEEDLPF